MEKSNNKRDIVVDKSGELKDESGKLLVPPFDWIFLAAGDAGITRKVTSKGEYWRVQFKKGRRLMSKGIWAPKATIENATREMLATRETEQYKKKRVSSLKSVEKKRKIYELEFEEEILRFLNFHPRYSEFVSPFAKAVAELSNQVGSGTVARTQMISIEERAAKAVVAWMRHQTTAYDNMKIPHIKGERRIVRKNLAKQSIKLLENYRNGKEVNLNSPLHKALLSLKGK
jgi:hypothetical protein